MNETRKNNDLGPENPPDLPRYRQLKELLLEQIQAGNLKPGSQIPTEAELCQTCGWSRPTVNRALRELEFEGVLTRIQGCGTFVATPRQSTTKSLSILICDAALNPENEYSGPIFKGIREVAAENQLDIVYYKQERIPEPQVVKDSRVDGVLLSAPNVDDVTAILKLQEAGKPVVALSMRSRINTITSVSTDNYEGIKNAVRHLASLGHQSIALVTTGLASHDVHERLLGFQNGLHEADIPIDPSWLLISNEPIANPVLVSWFDSLHPKPTAFIVCISLAFPLLQLALSRRLRVPQDLSIVVTDDSELLSNTTPTLSAIRQPLREMGRRGLSKLLAMIRGNDAGNSETLAMKLVMRDSVAAPPDPTAPSPDDKIFQPDIIEHMARLNAERNAIWDRLLKRNTNPK